MTAALSPTPELGSATHRAQRLERSGSVTAELTRVGWAPSGDLGIAEWSAVGRRFGEISRCSQWWLGDWINYGNSKFGERYSRAVKLTGYDVQSLMNMVYVASRFEIYRRRENLSWSHHATLASLERDGQEYWLARAIADRLSVSDLRVELRNHRRALEGPDVVPGPVAQPEPGHTLVCPNCGHTVPLPR
jgi:hypothetical protein